jgi:hypothetical protein
MRTCPQCNTTFVSNFDRGQCPHCAYHFRASEALGLPEGYSVADALSFSVEESQQFIEQHTLQRVATGSMEEPPESISAEEQCDYKWHQQWLQQGIALGGTLFAWHSGDTHSRFAGYVVIKDGQILAKMCTEICLSD